MKYMSALVLLSVAAVLVCSSTLYAECKEGQVDINTSSISQLKTVKGIGDKKAEAIIEGRPYTSVEDLRKVKGVGAKTLDKWRDQLCVGKAGAAPAAAAVSEPVKPKAKKYVPKKAEKEETADKEETESSEAE